MTYPVASHVIRVAARNMRWEVSVDGRTRRMIDWLCTKERATEHALEIARELVSAPSSESVDVIIEDGSPYEPSADEDAPRIRLRSRAH